MEEAVAVRHELNESTEIHDADDFTFVGLAFFGEFNDGVDHLESLVDSSLVGGSNFDVAFFVDFVDRDCSAADFLDALDNLSARADYSTDEFLRNSHSDDAGNVGLVVFAWSGNGLIDDVEDVETTFASLHKGFFEDFVAETVALDIHLSGSDAVDSTCNFEVHVAEVVFVAEDIAEDSVFGAFGISDKAHCDAADGFLHLDTGVEQGKCASADCGHRRRAVRLEDVADNAANIGEIVGEHALEGAVGKVAVADFTTAYAADSLGFACREGREVVVEEEALATLIEDVVEYLLVEFCAESDCRERLSLAASEDSRSVRSG